MVSCLAKAFAYGGSSCCQDGPQLGKSGKHTEDFYLDRQAPVGVDYVRRSILVEVSTLLAVDMFPTLLASRVPGSFRGAGCCRGTVFSPWCNHFFSLFSVFLQPEGLTREYTYSIFFCPNGKAEQWVGRVA